MCVHVIKFTLCTYGSCHGPDDVADALEWACTLTTKLPQLSSTSGPMHPLSLFYISILVKVTKLTLVELGIMLSN